MRKGGAQIKVRFQQTRFASAILDGVLGPPRLARHSWRCPCICSSGGNTRGESRALEGRRVSSKKPFKGPRQRQGSCWEEQKRTAFPRQGGIDLPFRQSNEFFTKRKQKIIELVATRPARGRHQLALNVPACPVHVEQHGLWGSRAHGGAFRQVAQPDTLSLLGRWQNANL